MEWFDGPQAKRDLIQLTALTVGAPSDAVTDHLIRLGFDVVSAASAQEVLGRLSKSAESFVLVAIGESVDHDTCQRLLEDIIVEHPELPLVHSSSNGSLRLLTNHDLYDGDPNELLRAALCRELYPDWLIDGFEEYIARTLETGFGHKSFPVQIQIRANRGTHDGILSFLPLTGTRTGGRITMYSRRDILNELSAGLGLGRLSREQRAIDLAGELVNQIAGRFKGDLVRRGQSVTLGTPVLVEGRAMSVHYGERQPSLHLEVTTEVGPLAFELCAGAALPDDNAPVNDDIVLEAGEVELF